MDHGVALNVGCGSDIRKKINEYPCINVDIRPLNGVDEIWDVRCLPIKDNTITHILASDIIEHFPTKETENILIEWARVLIPGGVLEIRTPDLDFIVEHYKKEKDAKFTSYHIFGGQDYETNFHYVIFDHMFLLSLCKKAGLIEVEYFQEKTNFRLKLRKGG